MTGGRARPVSCLTRHFFGGLFDFGFLSDVGTMSFTRLVLSICSLFLAWGLLLARVYMIKYGNLAMQPTAGPYRLAVLADHAFFIAIPMWVVALGMTLVGHAVFPDETDLRVLAPLPISRRTILTAKLCSLALFTGLFVAAAEISLVPVFVLTSASRWADGLFPVRAAAYGIAATLGALFAALGVTALQAVLVLTGGRGRALASSAAMRSVMLCALLLLLPLLGRLPARADAFAHGVWWIYFAPPAWFAGLEFWLQGDPRPHLARLSHIGAAAVSLAGLIAGAAYGVLYRHFERLIFRPTEKPPSLARRIAARPARPAKCPPLRAIRTFIAITLRRSVLHQGILVVLSAVGAGLVVNSFIAHDLVGWLRDGGPPRAGLRQAVIWTPFALMYVVCRAARTSLLVPAEPRANWIFRMTERDSVRPDQLSAAVSAVRRLGVVAPVGLLAILQIAMLGSEAVVVIAVTLLVGWCYVELLMLHWGRIPFTCSFIPGKGFVPQRVLIGTASFVAFTTAGSGLAQLARTSPIGATAVGALVLVVTRALRRWRLRTWRETPLEFEDALPSDVNPLRLTAD